MRPVVRYSLLGFVALLGAVAGFTLWLGPGWLAGQIREQLVHRAQRRGIALEIGHVWVDPTAAMTLDGLVLRDAQQPGAPPFARIPRLRVDWQLNGLLRPRVYLERVTIESPEVYAVRGADGRTNLESVVQRFLAPDADEVKRGAGWRKYLSRHLPDVEVNHLRGGLDDAGESAPATVGGIDLHHLRVADASFSLHNTSPVQETAHIELKANASVQGVAQPVLVTGSLDWPAREGQISVRLPGAMSMNWHGFRAQVGNISASTDGHVTLAAVHLARDATPGDAATVASRFELDIREIRVTISKIPGPEPQLPEALRGKVPVPVLRALRHVAEVAVLEPVVVAQRQSRPNTVASGDDDDDEAVEPLTVPEKDAAPTAKNKGKPLAGKGKLAPGKAVADKKIAGKDAKDKKPEGDGSIVREGLAKAFGKGADRLEHQLGRLGTLLGGIPVPVVTVQHGRARFRDESQGPASELSDVSGRIEHRPGENIVSIQLDFHVPGRKDTNTVAAHVDTKTGDAGLKVHLDRLPLGPYAALLPPSVTAGPTSAVQDAAATLQFTAATRRMAIDGHVTVADVDWTVAKISRQPLQHLTVTAKGRLELDLDKQTLQLQGGEVAVGKVHVLIDSSVKQFRTAPAFDVHLKIPTVACQDTVDSVPAGFAPMLDGMRCEGDLSYEINGMLDTAKMGSLKFDFEAALQTVRITNMGKYIHFDIFDAPFEHHARQKDASLYTFNTGPGTDLWVPLMAISPNFVKVLTTTEDGGFFGHRGFSLDSIKNAMIENLKRGRFVRGASTITQQLVKNLFFVEREKTISRKVQEAVITWQIERSLSKQQLLELYLNIIELGPKIYGIKAAAQHYFNRGPIDLTLLQAIWLGSIVPNPRAFYHQFRDGRVSDTWRTYLCWIGSVMLTREKVTAEEFTRLGGCNVVFGGGPDGSENPPPDMGLGHEGDPSLLEGDDLHDKDGRAAPGVPVDEQP